MKVISNEYRSRIEHWLRTLTDDLYIPLHKLELSAFKTMDQLSYAEAEAHAFDEIPTPYVWGSEWEYCWFRSAVCLPKEAEGKMIALNLDLSGEATIFVNGTEFGTYRAHWVKCGHHYIQDNILTNCGKAGTVYNITAEAYAGHFNSHENIPRGCTTGPVLPGAFEPTPDNNDRAVIRQPSIGIWNEDAYQLLMDAKTLFILLDTLEPSSLRAANIADGLEKFTRICEFEQPLEGRIESYRKAREVLKPLLECKNGSTAPQFYAVGNSHLDLAWLWPLQETYRKTARTFAAQLRHLENYPEYRYIQSQPASYEMCRRYYPELFEKVRTAIKEGKWIADGAMWVEPDTNLSGGEALVRQLMYGISYYRDVLGTESKVLWLPDTFGYSGVLPQLLKKSGIKYLVTQKIFWSYNDSDKFPYHYFTWEGIDGSKVTAFLPTSYVYDTDPQTIADAWKNRTQVRELDSFLLPFGYGDGGAGPARDHIEFLMREQNLEGMPKVKMTSPREFFEAMDEMGGPKSTYRGELYFTAHRGTYTTQAKVKKNNRKGEIALRNMELMGSLASLRGADYDKSATDRLWKELLLHQFHDILPGSSIARVYDEADVSLTKVIEEASSLTSKYAEMLCTKCGNAVTVFNTLSFARKELVELPDSFAGGAVTEDGSALPVCTVNGKVKALVQVPAMGSVTLYSADKSADFTPVTATEQDNGFVLENSLVKAVVNPAGEVISFILKSDGREFAAGAMNRLRIYKDIPRLCDAWDIDSNYIENEITDESVSSCRILSDNGLSAVLLRSGRIGNSDYTQQIVLDAESDRIEFRTVIEWRELHRLLKVCFPVDVYSNEAINEMQFGYVKRPVHRSRPYDKDRFEVCNHRYTVLADGSHGAAVLNDCKYGISVNENSLELTLLKAASAPAMRSDNHTHEFTYAFSAFEGTFESSDVVKQGLSLNIPMLVIPGKAQLPSFAEIDSESIILDTVKPAEDGSGDIILRFYEAKGTSGKAKVNLSFGSSAWLCNLMEENEKELEIKNHQLELSFGSFEVLSVRIKK